MGLRALASFCAALLVLAIAPQGAFALPVPEIEDPTVIDATAGTDLTLTTTGDVYVYIPSGFFYDQLTLNALTLILADGGVLDLNDPPICAAGCVLESYDLTGDVVLNVLDPLGTVSLASPNATILLTPVAIPEPGTALLLGTGLALLAGVRTRSNPFEPDTYENSELQVKGVNLESP